ncbi:MAG: 30S ribosomal protein S13, small subunit ribosomal protein S13 [Microgenomates group bacterium GW2011_GWC1_39_7b]|uniref:Small ribosomal subunit protein uS13 n=2 Tax=Candidatus Woeseibacteriota TaxID=1752722 RepID=A0A0G0LVK0_9BACT|nr:MAG: 30S ribosomal protein S13 [Candidatus Woesebacteria bacterium GW2011_GWB1_39_10]KKR27001.1 MAG: 30S ribosomal protein S13, small subunit ribosomal protein S13 [Microgenomates group bacterium GW2011_GWC1_39_7b]KKS90995.1 MAG: 30S ribosomal protein S13 [Candidatus Woesebacteria bacterium GW2011_GWA1_43_12]
MARIAGIELQDNWKVDYALTKVKGLGWSLSKRIMKDAGIDSKKRISDLSADEVVKISTELEKYSIEGDLFRMVRGNIQRLQVIGSYRGMRHTKGLPVRGQRTKTNARTKRGKRKTVGAFKKEMLSKMTAGKAEEAKK